LRREFAQPAFRAEPRSRLARRSRGEVAIARRVDAIETCADDRDAAAGAAQPAAMRRGVDADREPADDGEPGGRQCGAERFGVGASLRRRIAAADDPNAVGEQLAPAEAVEDGGRVADFEQRPRIVGVVECDQRGIRLREPGERALESRRIRRLSDDCGVAAGQACRRCFGVAARTASGLPKARSSSASGRGAMPARCSAAQASTRASTIIAACAGRPADGQGLRTASPASTG
jgi:hypothetical protein